MRTIIFCAAAILACLPLAALAQVEQVQQGNALDANPRVGSGGYNQPTPLGYDLGSQLYVTGQVRGLAAFRGRTGYVGPGQLDLHLPSAGLSAFRAQSVGLSDVLTGSPYLPAPYFDPYSMVTTVPRAILAPLGPSAGAPLTTTAGYTGLSQQLYVDALANSSLPGTRQPGRAIEPYPSGAAVLAAPVASPTAAAAAGPGPMPVNYTELPQAPIRQSADLFAVPRPKDQIDLARELYVLARKDTWQDSQIDTRLTGRTAPAPPIAGLAPEGTETPSGGTAAAADRTGGVPLGRMVGQPVANQDVFLDMLLRMRERREALSPKPPPAPGEEGLADATPPPVAGTRAVEPPKKLLVELTGDQDIVVHGLAGQGADVFNAYMTRGARDLLAGRFYDAAGQYETAATADPRNPLARVGMGLSLLGAGEPLSAAFQLQRALAVFPPLGEAQIDLPGMIDPKVIQAQLEKLDQRIAQLPDQDKALLTFLATFLYYNTNQTGQARTYAEKLEAAARNDAFLKAYANFILKETGEGQPKTPKLTPKAPSNSPATPGKG